LIQVIQITPVTGICGLSMRPDAQAGPETEKDRADLWGNRILSIPVIKLNKSH
jgi:hypothetical protein